MSLPVREDVPRELRLLGLTSDEARAAVEKFLDDAVLAGHREIRLVHGKGTGALRRAVEGCLRGHPLVGQFRLAEPAAGGAGVTVVALEGGATRRGARADGAARAPSRAGGPADESAPRGPRRDPGARGSRGPRGGGRAAQARRRALEGPLPLPPGEDALLHGPPEAEPLPLLRLPRRRRRLRVPAPARSPRVPRGRAPPGRAGGRPLAGARVDAGGRAPATGSSRSWSGPRAASSRGSGRRRRRSAPAPTSTDAGSGARPRAPSGSATRPRAGTISSAPRARTGHPVEALARRRGSCSPGRTPPATTTASAGGSSSRSRTPRGASSRSGAAALAGEEPKYLNSPETPLYQKGQTLYALHRARERMTETRRALLVEGYVDCLMAHQHGFGEAVAVLGTALTPPQLGLLRRYADEAILFFDADRAGQEAARRAEDLLERSADPQWWALTRRPDTLARRGPPAPGRDAPGRPRPRHVPPRRGPRGPRGGLPRRPAAPPLRARPCVLRGGHGEPAGPRHRQRPRRPHALEGAGRRRGDRARARGGPAARRRPERPLAPGPAPGRGGPPGRRRRSPRSRRTAQDVTLVRAGPLPARAPGAGGARGAPAADRRRRHRAPRGPGHPGGAPGRARAGAGRRSSSGCRTTSRATLLARWLVEEREWPDLAAEVAARRRRLERRQAQRRVREISQTVARSEASGATTDFNSLHAAIGQETPRIRADAGGSP